MQSFLKPHKERHMPSMQEDMIDDMLFSDCDESDLPKQVFPSTFEEASTDIGNKSCTNYLSKLEKLTLDLTSQGANLIGKGLAPVPESDTSLDDFLLDKADDLALADDRRTNSTSSSNSLQFEDPKAEADSCKGHLSLKYHPTQLPPILVFPTLS